MAEQLEQCTTLSLLQF